MPPTLTQASEVRPGDLLESPIDMTWQRVEAIDRQYGRYYFIMGVISRSALEGDLILVGKL